MRLRMRILTAIVLGTVLVLAGPVRPTAQTQTPAAAQAQTAVQAGAPTVAPDLKVGDIAPGFALPGSDGTTHRLADYKGVKPVVLAWFPRMPIKD